MEEKREASPQITDPEEARQAHAALRARAVRLMLLRSLCMGIAVALFMAFAVLYENKAVTQWIPAACLMLALAALAGTVTLLILVRKLDRRMKALLPVFPPASVREASDELTRTMRDTRPRRVTGIILLIAGILVFVFGISLSMNNRWLIAGVVSAAASGGCIAAGAFLVSITGGLRAESRIRAALCALPVYEQAVRDCLGEDAAYDPSSTVSRGDRRPPYERGCHYIHKARNRIRITRRGCSVRLWDADISYSDSDRTYSVFSGVYVQILLGRTFPQGFTLEPPTRKQQRAAEGEKSAATAFEARFAPDRQGREACERLLTPHLKSVIALSPIDRLAVLPDGSVHFGIRDLTLFPNLADAENAGSRLKAVTEWLLPLIDELTVLRDAPADDFAK